MKNLVKIAKRMMIVGIMVMGFMMPAQVSAQNANRGDGKGRTVMVQKDNKKGNKKENKKGFKKEDKKYKNKKDFNKKHKAHKPKVVVKKHHHHKNVVHHHHTVVHNNCNGAAEAIGTVIGLAALVALIAN